VRVTRWRPAIRLLAFGLVLIGNIGSNAGPPEPEEYRMDDYRAPVPETVAGGMVLDTNRARELWQTGNAVWIDVLPAPRRPVNLPAGAFWMPLPHRDIPGSLWLPDVGRGALSPELEGFFQHQLEAASKGRKDAEIAFYCVADCWMSWNATKRAASWGYTRLFWYRDGIDGWGAAKLPLEDREAVRGR
jgi:PQQ-dependent catabolism-associated CXXCW motif protein